MGRSFATSVNDSNEPGPVQHSAFHLHRFRLWTLMSKQTAQIVLHHSPFLAPLLQQEPSDVGQNQSVLIHSGCPSMK